MRDMVMQMSGPTGVFSVPDEHLPGLMVLILIGPVIWIARAGLRALAARRVGWADRTHRRLDQLPFAAKVALFGSLVGALVHAAIVPTHWGDERVTAILFVVDTIGFGVAFWWTFILSGALASRLGRHARWHGVLLRLLHPQGVGDDGPRRPRHDHR